MESSNYDFYHEKITMLLLRGTDAINKDVYNFREWESGSISINECYKRFRKNNRQNRSIEIPLPYFQRWLNSLGYLREPEDNSKWED